MTLGAPPSGDDRPDTGGDPAAEPVALAFAAIFRGGAGAAVVRHLRRMFLDRRISPKAGDAELWHLEGQRSVVSHLLAMVERGRGGGLPPEMR